MSPPIEMYPFRYRDPLTRKWVKARYLAERHEIAVRYAEWEIIGPPEIRGGNQSMSWFSPWRGSNRPTGIRIRRGSLSLRLVGEAT